MNKAPTNALIKESSPYLLQHAHNPVNWQAWGPEALEKARKEKRLLIVSIGYSSCHWCHVMEHESFEDPEVARIMNAHFVPIKIDREERPDIDHIYMTALHLMNQQGGWPLNCIALPDGRPIWGGTYFPKEQWISALTQVLQYHQEHPDKSLQVAEQLAAGIRQSSTVLALGQEDALSMEAMDEAVEQWSSSFDREEGGFGAAPKFPMPANLEFLLHYAHVRDKPELLEFIELTLLKMARGGIYDQVGGGFARYAVDALWKVPHFEKMAYDNGQLLSLYAHGYQVFGHDEFREVLEQTVGFIQRELRSDEGLFYAALDADSEGVEGKFYTWTEEELKKILGSDYDAFAEYYHVNGAGLWEHGKNILLRNHFSVEAVKSGHIKHWQELLLEERQRRVGPGLDNKCLASWNALVISGLVDVFRATGMEKALTLAREAAEAVRDLLYLPGKVLYRNHAGGKASIPGFHIDYSLVARACLDLYEVLMEEAWIHLAEELCQLSMELFASEDSPLFQYNAHHTEVLVSRHQEIQDNVIPSSNGVMAHVLQRLGHHLGRPDYLVQSRRMLKLVSGHFQKYPMGFALWGRLALLELHPFYEIAVSGPEAEARLREISREYLPQSLMAGSEGESSLPLFTGRFSKGKTHIFVCRDQVCELPVEKLSDAKAIYQR